MTPAQLSRLHHAAFSADRGWSTDEFARLLAQPTTLLFTGANAFLLARAVAGEGEILTLCTHPAARRQGQARSLLTQLLDHATSKAFTSIFLEVAADNHAARALYTAHGFHETGRRPGYYARKAGPSVDALVLSARIGPA